MHAVHGALAAVAAAVVHDPEHAAGRGVGLGGHDLFDESTEGFDPGGGFAAAEDAGVVDVPGSEVREGATAVVFVLDARISCGGGAEAGVAADAGLDRGLLVGGDHEVAFAQRSALPGAGVEVERPAGFGLEGWVAREDP